MDIKSRLKNKTTLIALLVAVITCIYSILSALGITPSVSQDTIVSIISALVTALCTLGILVDPTTPGISDKKDE